MTKAIVGIPTYNGYERVDWLLHSIFLRSSEGDREILKNSKIAVCDDSSKKEHQNLTKNVVDKWKNNGLPVELIINERNIGVAASWNRLAKSDITSEHIILINDDIIVSSSWLESMVYFLDNNPDVGAAGHFCYFITRDDIETLLSNRDAIVIPRDPFKKTQTEKYSDMLEYPGRCMAAGGCFFGMNKKRFNEVGGFDETYKSFYEESDMGTMLASKGYPSYCLSFPKNWHIWSQTFSTAPEINAGEVMNNSRQYYIKKWGVHYDGELGTHKKFMSKIPFQKIKFKYKDQEYEKIIDAEDGYYASEEDRKIVNTLTRIR